MENLKKILSLVLTLVMVITIIPALSVRETKAVPVYYVNNVGYSIINTSKKYVEAGIILYKKDTQNNTTIPATVKIKGTTYKVTKVELLSGSDYPKSTLTIQGTNVTSITLTDCTSKKVDLSGCTKITSIKKHMFQNCTNLTTVVLPSSITTIGACAFANCPSLKSINIANTAVTSIPQYCFYNDTSLTGVTLPATVKKIDSFAFAGCSSITSIVIPTGVTHFGYNCFTGIKSTATITFKTKSATFTEDSSGNSIFDGKVTSKTIFKVYKNSKVHKYLSKKFPKATYKYL